ncbi:DUF2970 domain-containing protein [Bowmanella pacifica]|uniref:DUF2970 domain-containing protein n=1 Tax=Bowmanella pacifica TaxID=502051 RepID=A0A918DI85_9ALTE|nr:DUF2970 domain-containing protein [Bowmanella pacifica]GGO65679.1 hypothetical protein GCM10010982_08050 [Bowmanella pacifica]
MSSPSWTQILKSVLASAFGVQSAKNRQQDFENSASVLPYLVVGVFFVALFVFGLVFLVNWLVK